MDKVVLYKDDAGEWRWHRKSENGQIVSTSGEGYQNRVDALNIARDVNGVNDVAWETEE